MAQSPERQRIQWTSLTSPIARRGVGLNLLVCTKLRGIINENHNVKATPSCTGEAWLVAYIIINLKFLVIASIVVFRIVNNLHLNFLYYNARYLVFFKVTNGLKMYFKYPNKKYFPGPPFC